MRLLDIAVRDARVGLNRRGRKGQRHKDNPLRRFDDHKGRHLAKWDSLGLGENVVI